MYNRARYKILREVLSSLDRKALEDYAASISVIVQSIADNVGASVLVSTVGQIADDEEIDRLSAVSAEVAMLCRKAEARLKSEEN